MEILKIEHLSKMYGKGETAVKALDDVSFSIQKGEFVAIIGPSGSGKSTLLHLPFCIYWVGLTDLQVERFLSTIRIYTI